MRAGVVTAVCVLGHLQVSLDVKVGDKLGRLVLGLYGNVVPKTVSYQHLPAW